MEPTRSTATQVTVRGLRAAALYSFVTGAATAAGTGTVAWIVWFFQSR
ncbi:hypothetical protein OG211_32260 [Streptomyces niveus]|uniref:Uncharacterized protein n=1 Tax=Streptomyces niveus TaxID=193462 RepID=A0ABZ1ZYL5_STRNV|nr:hypothetical protein [Streptomyces niveus]WTA62830.1 hypothetical protein OG211_32260 [Streptomyces niveus]